jgi:glycosyltransferase involved in cell wall biosynthesis
MHMDIEQLKSAALIRRNAGDFEGAEAMFRQALTMAPNDVDCAHMVGVLCFRTGRAREAIHFFLRAGMLSEWKNAVVARNFGLALSFLHGDAVALQRVAYQTWLSARRRHAKPVTPLVTVIVPSYNHAAFIAAALDSVYRQTWAKIELIVIDDGSHDGSVDIIRDSLKACPFPHQLIARENRGASATINEGVSLARGEYFNILNSDDCFLPTRIEKMVHHVAAMNADWGFAGVDIINAQGEVDKSAQGTTAAMLNFIAGSAESSPTIGFALVRHNVAISTGNLFVRKAFFQALGGFSELRYVHDLEFALRTTLHAEPVYVSEALYRYRLHGDNTITESAAGVNAETIGLIERHFETLMSAGDVANPFAPTRHNWGEFVAAFMLRYGFGGMMRANQLAHVAQHLAATASAPDSPPTLARIEQIEGVADARAILALASKSPDSNEAAFDQVQRYRLVALAIEHLRRVGTWGKSFSILEIGAAVPRLQETMLPADRITHLDHEVPDLSMKDGQFDIVIALDVMEHIEPTRRDNFLHHINRLSRVATLVAAPFDSEAVRDAMREVGAFSESLVGSPHRGLVLQLQNGLPDLANTKSWLENANIAVTHFGHGEISLWQDMMKANFAAEASTDLRSAATAVNRFYRDHVFANDFGAAHHYREFLLCTKDAGVATELEMFCADLKSKKRSVDLTPLQDVLNAIQYAGKNRAVLY